MNRGGFSWNRLLSISAAKARISRHICITRTRSGIQRKLGAAMGCSMIPVAVVVAVAMGSRLVSCFF